MNNLKERLLILASYYNLSIRKFEEKCNLTRSLINNMKDDSTLGSDKLSLIVVNCPEVNPDWIVTGRGEMLQISILNEKVRDQSLLKEKEARIKELSDMVAMQKQFIENLQNQINQLQRAQEDLRIEKLEIQRKPNF